MADNKPIPLLAYINTHKIRIIIWAFVCILLALYASVFFVPKRVQFSYAEDSCARQLTIFPNLHRAVSAEQFKVKFNNHIKVGNLSLASTQTCFEPVSEPRAGAVAMQTAPFGGVFARKNFSLVVPDAPVADTTKLEKPLPATQPLLLELSAPDRLNTYEIETATKRVDCVHEKSQLECDLPSLELKQGKKYTLTLTRQFNEQSKKILTEKTVRTLEAVEVEKISVKDEQILYAKPKTFIVKTDKLLKNAEVSLVAVGKRSTSIDVKTTIKNKQLTLSLSKHLAREKTYKLTIKKLEAVDGSTLIAPKKVTFATSGGPKVTGITIGKTGVDSSATITVTFDQSLGDQDIAKYLKVKGGDAVVAKQDKTATLTLQNLPRCQVFSIELVKGFKSKYGVVSDDTWSYSSRTRCHSVITYGTSVRGRPLQAYIFGNGGSTTMYVGAIHGNESSSSGLLQQWVAELEAHPDRLKGKNIVVVPTINPDGVAAGTRTNSRGVNLNRNFPTDNWERTIDDTDGVHKNGGGKKPLSEPEAKALASLTQQYRPRLMLSFHAIGSVISGDPGEISATYAAKYASMVGYRDATANVGDVFEYSITGAYEQWAYEEQGIPNMVVELDSYTGYSFDQHRVALWAMVQ